MGIFDRFFKPKNESKDLEIRYDLAVSNSDKLVEIDIGKLHVPSGKIIVADPFFTDSVQSFIKTVRPGIYPVKLYIDKNSYRIAFAKLKIKNKKATNWILGLTEGQKIEDLKSVMQGEYFGFPVDAGLACFVDAETNAHYLKKQKDFKENNPDGNYYDDVLSAEFEAYASKNKYSRKLGDWNNHIVDGTRNLNVLMFASGWGDGYYPTYWGRDDQQEIVELTIDFLINLEED